ncbi:MAG: hypothetical protein P9M14_07405 [Candidatus Alcyoniella australis]|nr:hypothetical protein [Candidatus Alcyoniella australis]
MVNPAQRFGLGLLLIVALVLIAALCLGACEGSDDDDDDEVADDDLGDDDTGDDDQPFEVGFARVELPVEHSVMMGGYGTYFLSDYFCRWSSGTHDPLYATAAAFAPSDAEPIIVIHIDAVGVIITEVERIQQQISEALAIAPERIVVCSSHSHGAPDTVGIWGVMLPPKTGRDDDYIEALVAGAVQAGLDAYQARTPATLEFAAGTESDLHYNPQTTVDDAAITDDNTSLMVARDAAGELIGTLFNWGCHPMVMGPQNSEITADYPGAYYRLMDAEIGGINMYVNSSLGATVHPQNPEYGFEIDGNQWGTWEDVDNFGRVLADDAQLLLLQAQTLTDYRVHLVHKEIYGKLENPLFAMAGELDLIPRDMPPLGEYGATTMTAFSIGNVRFGTVPGELVPDLGLECRALMGGDHQFLITLGMDWLGYIMTEEQYRKLTYIYFSILSVGPEMGPKVIEEYTEIFNAWPE